jgi:hypothetical protein
MFPCQSSRLGEGREVHGGFVDLGAGSVKPGRESKRGGENMRRLFVLAIAAIVVSIVFSGTAAAQRTQDTLICGGIAIPITVTSTNNDNAVAWGVGTISGGDHFIPTSFSGTLVDLTTGETLFSFFPAKGKGKGKGQHNQAQMTCTTPTDTGTAGEFGISGVNPDDVVQFSLTVTVVRKP